MRHSKWGDAEQQQRAQAQSADLWAGALHAAADGRRARAADGMAEAHTRATDECMRETAAWIACDMSWQR